MVLSLGSYNPEDPSLNTFSSVWSTPTNVLGYFGSWLSDALYQLVGHTAWVLPLLLFVALVRWLMRPYRSEPILGARWWIALGCLIAAAGLALDLVYLHRGSGGGPFPPQGLVGIGLGASFRPLVGRVGCGLIVLSLIWAFCMIWWESLPGNVIVNAHRAWAWAKGAFGGFAWKRSAKASGEDEVPAPTKIRVANAVATTAAVAAPAKATKEDLEDEEAETDEDSEEGLEASDAHDEDEEESEEADYGYGPGDAKIADPVIRKEIPEADTRPRAKLVRAARPVSSGPVTWELPPLSLLEHSKRKAKVLSDDQVKEIAKRITVALRSFEIEGQVEEVTRGPIITMYEFRPAPGVRASRIVAAATDLAMTLGVPSVRVVAPIPGKSVAGIEVPNPDKEDIVLRDVFEQTSERSKGLKLPLCLGKDIEGRPIVEDLSRMPHLLIGGATSMGKSVLVNSVLTSLLCRFTPDELRLVIVDPKLVEFKAFEDIPHLLLPIVNDPSDASQALKWAVAETRRRYLLMQKVSAKNLEGYNQKVAEFDESKLSEGEEKPSKFPYIVIIIDELAELMLTGRKDVEHSIVRLSQLARAAGIHLVMATQRPSADVVTGLIKSNCPARASLRVASASDSRIILDCAGAEQLLGRGDMFFTNSGPMGLRRMQSSFVSDDEIDKVCNFWRGQGEPDYRDEILNPESAAAPGEAGSGSADRDELFGDVIDFAKQNGKISTSLIQRRFSIGYTRAARIMEQLEAAGLVGEQSAAGKPREVLA